MEKGDWKHLAAAALLAAAGALVYGYSFGASSNHALYVPAVVERLSPGLYAGDPAVAAAARAPTVYWDLLYVSARGCGLELAAFLLWLAAALGLGAVTWAAARAAGGTRRAAYLAVLFAAVSGVVHVTAPWAGDPLAKPFADPTGAAWVAALAAVACWLSERGGATRLLLFAAALLSPLTAWLTAAALAAASWPERRLAARTAVSGAAALAAAAAVLWLLGRLGRGELSLAEALTPNTYASAAWPWERWL
ncbi:MAG: hypothetical protein KGL53_06840, partial [Elusimicrobia bacterium]|nr:hypothetical protein [Elusimicrobiota bacterium]